MADAPVQTSQATPPRTKKRWVLRIVGVLGFLLLLIALIVQIVLWTDIPRKIVIGQIEQQLGLRLNVKSLSTGWLGHTQLNDVTIALPLAKKAFLDVRVLKVKNTSLFGLILGRPVEIKAIELDQPHVYVWQDAAGRWNLQEVAELLARAGGKKSGQQSAQTSSTPSVPNIHLVGGIVSIIDNKNRSTQIEPLSVEGYRETGVSWKYDVEIPPRVSVTGRLVPGGNWSHELVVKLQDIGYWAKPWMKDFPAANVDVSWRGALSETGISGRVEMQKVTVVLPTGPAEAYGAVSAGFNGGVITLSPDNLLLKTGQKALPDFTLTSGAVTFTPARNEIKVEQLLVSLFGGPARVSALYNLNTKSGRVDAGWERLALSDKIIHSGSFAASLSQPFPNLIILDGNLKSTGDTPSGPWTATAKFGATGESFTSFDWNITTDKAEWKRRGEGINLDGIAMSGSMRADTITLSNIGLPKQELLSGNATYQLTGNQLWQAKLQGQHWPFHPIAGTELGFDLKIRGNKQMVRLDDFVLKSPDVRLSANGMYVFGKSPPVELNVTITNAPPLQAPMAVASTTEAKIINGTLEGTASLAGTLWPNLELQASGYLHGREIDIRGHHLGEINLALSKQSHVDSNGVFIYTESLTFLGGQWGFDGIYVFNKNGLDVDVNLKNVALKDVGTLAGRDDITGTLDGQASMFIPGLSLDPNHLEVPPANFKLKNLNAAGVLIDEIDTTVSLSDGQLKVDPIRLKHGDGRGEIRVALNVNDFRRIGVRAAIAAWPLDIPGALVHVDASMGIPECVIELPNPQSPDPAQQKLRITARQIDINGATTLKKEVLGDLVVHAGLNGREIDLRAAHMRLLGGRVDGQAHANLDNLQGSTAEFTWEKLDLKKLALIFPQLKDMNGRLVGSVRLAPSTVPRAREPLAVVITTKFDGGAWRTVPIQDLRIAGYIGPNEASPGAGWRMVLEDSKVDPSFLHAANGTVELWWRFGAHGRGNSSQAQVTFRDLDLDVLVHAIDPTAKPMPGKVGGTLMLIRAPAPLPGPPPLPLDRMFPARPAMPVPPATAPAGDNPPLRQIIEPVYAEGKINLRDTNLANFGPFAFLYNAANLFQNVQTIDGKGNVQFRMERGTLSIERMRYFYRGTEIRAVAKVDKIWDVPNSPIVATGLLTARPLRNVKIPFFSDFDTALTAIQSSLKLTGARITGTLKDKTITQLGLAQLGDEMRRFLVGDAKEAATGGTTGGGDNGAAGNGG